MDRESVERLRFDRRLHRREWVSDSEREEYLNSLPDVTDKMTQGPDEDEAASAADDSVAPPAPAFGEATPPAAAPLAPQTPPAPVAPSAPSTPPTPIPFGSSATPDGNFPSGGSGGNDDGGGSSY